MSTLRIQRPWVSAFLPAIAFSIFCIGFAEHVTPGGRSNKAASGAFLAETVRDELHQAIAAALGDGDAGRLRQVRASLEPMWRSLAKNDHGRVDRRTLRYAVHRYLLKTHGISIVGLEPLQQGANSTTLAALFVDHAPSYVKTTLEGDNAEKGYSIDDVAAMILMLQELVAHQSHNVLERIFREQGIGLDELIQPSVLDKMMETYLLRWMMGGDQETIDMIENNDTLLEESFENWRDLVGFTRGLRLAYARSKLKQAAWLSLKDEYSYEDAHAVAGRLHLEFGNYWHLECVRVKESLIKLDYGSAGRVKLSDFHAAALDGEWRFGESKEYLRSLGALDESSSLLGPRVFVANYLQGASNCIISEPQYRVCCVSDCEDHLAEIEAFVQEPLATPEQILSVVGNITVDFHDKSARLTSGLKSQLQDIADTHSGRIPLHGRLFAQWLSFVFPQDCPFPHKSGTVASMAPLEFGHDFMASEHEIQRNANDLSTAPAPSHDDDSWKEQWSDEEELLTDNIRVRGLLGKRAITAIAAILLAGGAYMAWLQVQQGQEGATVPKNGGLMHTAWAAKAHYV